MPTRCAQFPPTAPRGPRAINFTSCPTALHRFSCPLVHQAGPSRIVRHGREGRLNVPAVALAFGSRPDFDLGSGALARRGASERRGYRYERSALSNAAAAHRSPEREACASRLGLLSSGGLRILTPGQLDDTLTRRRPGFSSQVPLRDEARLDAAHRGGDDQSPGVRSFSTSQPRTGPRPSFRSARAHRTLYRHEAGGSLHLPLP